MREMLKLGRSLCVFALIAALALAATNAITKGPIAQQELAASQAAQRAVLPTAEVFEQQEPEKTEATALINELYAGKVGEAVVGYVMTAAPQGYGGPIPITLGIGVDGSVHGISVGDLQETAGLGMKVGEEPFKSQFYGIEADPDTINDNVSVISGATVSSKPFIEAVRQMFDYSKNVLAITPNAAAPALEGDDLVRKAYIESAEAFAAVDMMQYLGDYGTIRSVHSATLEKETVGYVFEMTSVGFDAERPIAIRMGISSDGKITQVQVVDSFVSEGYTSAGDTTVFDDQFAGKDATEDGCALGIEAVAGATVSSDAIVKAVKQAVSFYNTYLNAPVEEIAGTVYDVNGFNPMKVAVDVDAEGKIVSVKVVEHNETPALGGKIIDDVSIFDALAGKPVAQAQIDVVAHCTMTCTGINNALRLAAGGEAVDVVTEATGSASSAAAEPEVDTTTEATSSATAVSTEPEVNTTPEATGSASSAAAEPEVDTTTEATSSATTATTENEADSVYEVYGFNEGTPMKVSVEVDAEGKIVSVSVVEHAETPALGGTVINNAETFAALVGQDIAQAQIDAVAHCTMTCDGLNKALKLAAEAFAAKEVQ